MLRFLQALGSESRLKLIRLLSRSGSLCVGAIAQRLDLTQSAVSQHLRILEEAGLVLPERRGMRVHYSIARSVLESWLEELDGFLDN